MNAGKLPESFLALSKIFLAQGYSLYVVGGFVRNIVLGISGGDYDVCSAALPETAAAFLRAAGLTVIEKALQLGTIEIHLFLGEEKHVFEHTTFRRDYYPHGGHHRPYRVAFTRDIGEDARRRDFTAGALYLDIATGSIIDPTNKGLDDIKNRRIRAAAPDPDETIRDDGLRIMRMARFAAELKFSISPELLACAQKRASLLNDISAERKRDELSKIIMADARYPSLVADAPVLGLDILRQTSALPYILPILSEGSGVAQSGQYHKYDVLGHGIHACAAAAPVFTLRLAALLHDIGKPRALRQNGNMYGHEVLGESLAREELSALRFDNKTKHIVLTLIRNHMFDLEGKARPKTIRRRAIVLGKEMFLLLIALRRADFLGSGMGMDAVLSADNWQKELDRMLALGVPWSVGELAVTGEDIIRLGIGPSPDVGRILDALFWECVANPGANRPELLKARAAKLIRR